MTLSAAYSTYLRCLVLVLNRLPGLTELDISLRQSTPSFVKQLAKMIPQTVLQQLRISHLNNRYKYLAMLLRSSKTTLVSLCLEYITLEKEDEHWPLFGFLGDELKLRRCRMHCLTINGKRIDFSRITKSRPITALLDTSPLDGDEWALVQKDHSFGFALDLSADEGDDIRHWLQRALLEIQQGDVWGTDVEDE